MWKLSLSLPPKLRVNQTLKLWVRLRICVGFVGKNKNFGERARVEDGDFFLSWKNNAARACAGMEVVFATMLHVQPLWMKLIRSSVLFLSGQIACYISFLNSHLLMDMFVNNLESGSKAHMCIDYSPWNHRTIFAELMDVWGYFCSPLDVKNIKST